MRQEERYTNTPKVDVKMGHGLGRVVDASLPHTARRDITTVLGHAQAGSRLLITANSHHEIKEAEKHTKAEAKRLGLTLVWRFSRECRMEKRYIHPEWVPIRITEYLAWVLVKARHILNVSSPTKQGWWARSVIGQLDRADVEIGAFPAWVYEMGEDDGPKRTSVYWLLKWQENRDAWSSAEYEDLPSIDLDDPEKVVTSLDERI